MFPVALIIVGVVIAFGGFFYALVNMRRGFTEKSLFSDFGGMFRGHFAAMAVMAVGALIAVIGFVLGGWQLLQQLLPLLAQ